MLSDDEINERVNCSPVPVDDVVPVRWRSLLRGLLTWRPENRWGARQVQEWLEGAEPAIDEHVGPDEQAGGEFVFAGARITRPRQLAAAMAANWQAAGELVLGDGWSSLLEWASSVSDGMRSALDDVDEHFVQPRSPVDRCVCELMVRLDVSGEPRFRGFVVDRPGLAQLAVESESGDTAARAALDALLHSGALRALARLSGQGGLDLVAAQWERWHRMAEDYARDALGDLSRLPERQRLGDMVLRAVLDPVYRRNLNRRARELTTRRARRTAWFRALTDQDPGVHQPALDVVVVLLAALAEETRRRPPTEQDEFAAAARGLRAEVEAMVSGVPSTGDWIAAVPALPVRDRPVTVGDHLRFGGAVVGTAIAGGSFAVVAGIGVAAGSSLLDGVLAGMVLLAGTASLLAGLLLPRTPLSGALLGAAKALVVGLIIAVAAAVVVGLVLGRELGVLVFWCSWVLTVFTGAVSGAVTGRTRGDVWWRVTS
jgi:hypothetical protein